MQALQRAWLRRGPLACLLWPVSLLFGALSTLRTGLYAIGMFRTARARVPVVVVGNVVAGGSGKTPVVEALVNHLRDRGLQVGIVSRGHGRTGTECREVRPGNDPRLVGDEPLLLALSCGVPVFVAARRMEAVEALLARHPRTQVIVSDDGLQHRAMGRDIEICVFDARGVGNGWWLPAGPLRESWPRRVDFVLKSAQAPGIDGFDIERRLADEAVCSDGSTFPLDDLRNHDLVAVAGIGVPHAFFAMLEARGLRLAHRMALPDHADFAGVSLPRGDVVCTMKDAVKLWRTHPQAIAVPLAIDIAQPFWEAFDHAVDAKLSSRDGSQTA